MDRRTFKCFECDHVWEVEFGVPRPSECPECGSSDIHREDGGRRYNRQRRRQRNGMSGRKRN